MTKRPAPTTLFIYLHGHSETPVDAAVVVSSLDPNRSYESITPAGSIELENRFAWFENDDFGAIESTVRDSAKWLASEVKTLQGEFNVAPERTILGGYSQGAAMALALLEYTADPIGLLVLNHGFIPEGRDYELAIPKGAVISAVVQSSRDDDVTPPFMSDGIASVLKASGAEVEQVVVNGGHTLGSSALTACREWIRNNLP